MKKNWNAFGVTFTDVFEIHEKIDVNIAGDVWQTGESALFKINMSKDVRTV